MRTTVMLLSLLVLPTVGFAQDPPEGPAAPGGGWRRMGDTPPAQQDEAQRQTPERPPDPEDRYVSPGQLTIQPGTFLTVRVNEWLSSDRNAPGDAFSGTLLKPVVVDGLVVAQRGQTVGGRVVEAQRAGRGQPSRLGLQITELTVADGQQVPVQSQLESITHPDTRGRDAGTIVGTTVTGAAIGGIAGRGVGAAVGAMVGAAAGVILTRDHPTVIYPETVLTFRVETPVTVSTDRAPQAFHPVDQRDYEQDRDRYRDRRYYGRAMPPPPPCYSCLPPYYYGPRVAFFYGYGYGPYYGYGPRYWGPRHYRPWIW